MLKIFRVADGQADLVATPSFPEFDASQADWTNSIFVAAQHAEAALRLAERFDAGEIQQDNLAWGKGTAVVVIDPTEQWITDTEEVSNEQ